MPNIDPENYRVRLLLYEMNGTPHVFKSFVHEDKKGTKACVAGLTRRILKRLYLGKYNTAIFYDRSAGGIEIEKWVRGVREV